VPEPAFADLRTAYGNALVRLMEQDERIVVLDADLCRSTMTVFAEQRFPGRFIEMGIAEQNMTATAAGLALEGKIPFVNSFAVFATGRAYDQIRQAVSIAALNVKIVGSSSGLSDFGDGATHQSVEDLSLMRSIPNMTVLSPADALDVEQALPLMVSHQGPVYLRLNRGEVPVLGREMPPLDLAGVRRYREGSDAVVFATGSMLWRALDAANALAKDGISVRVVNVTTLKPLAVPAILAETAGMRAAVTAEEHSVIGGLGCAIASALRRNPLPLEFVGINDCFGVSGQNHAELMQLYGLTPEAIVVAVRSLLDVGVSASAPVTAEA
jgi:transketolase